MLTYLTKGIILGATAAAQPGPFQAYLMSEVSRQGWRRTLPAALAPLISDGPIVVFAIWVLSRVPATTLGYMQVTGGLFILYLAFRAFKSRTTTATESSSDGSSRGVLMASIMNLLNPNPYIFWGTVGGPIVIDGWQEKPAHAIAFLVGMYLFLVGGLALFVVLIGQVGALSEKTNRWLSLGSSLALGMFGIWQLWSGFERLAL